MEYQEAQRLFYELLDEWKVYHETDREMRAKVTLALSVALSAVAKGGAVNPSLGVLAMLESLERMEQQLQDKRDEVVRLIDD